ncbi:MAG: hypothetical protein ABFD50_08195 [Smithella sp.]
MAIIPLFGKTKKSIIAVDPGLKGAIVLIETDGTTLAYEKNKMTTQKFVDVIKWFSSKNKDTVAYMENVHALPKNGVNSMFTFGKELGWYNGVFSCLDIMVHRPAPQLWQNRIGVVTIRNRTYTKRKEDLYHLAMERFGHLIEVTSDNCDALLIGHYATMMES